MEQPAVWPTQREQCCDAEGYLEEGAICAAGGGCYDPLRPLGSGLWFGALDALGVPPAALFWVHGLLLLLSVWLSLKVARRWLQPALASRPDRWQSRALMVCGIGSLLAHVVFLQPVLPHSLADPPAALLTLIAIWVVLLGDSRSPAWRYALIGGLLGLTAFVRAYYLYPVLGWLLVSLLLWARDRDRRWRELWLAVALLPIAIQYVATWRETGALGYISPDQETKWRDIHLRDGSMGYDTLLRPIEAFRWPSPCSADNRGPLQALEQRDPVLATCIFASRLNFYLGSYAASTYLQPAQQVLDRFDDVDLVGKINLVSTRADFNAERAPDGRQSASRLSVQRIDSSAGLQQAFLPRFREPYSYSVWLWAPRPADVELLFYRQSDRQLVASRRVRLGSKAERYSISGAVLDTSTHVIFVGRDEGRAVDWGRRVGDQLFLWGGKLERGEQPRAWKPAADPRLGEARRIWSPILLFANGAALAVLVALLWMQRRAITRHHVGVLLLLGLLLAEGLLIVPEQRFVIAVLTGVWTLACFAVVAAAAGRGAARRNGRTRSSSQSRH
ncbi:MAG: hypothetical protein ACT4NL_06375 [Pseudomarimonas sp.]